MTNITTYVHSELDPLETRSSSFPRVFPTSIFVLSNPPSSFLIRFSSSLSWCDNPRVIPLIAETCFSKRSTRSSLSRTAYYSIMLCDSSSLVSSSVFLALLCLKFFFLLLETAPYVFVFFILYYNYKWSPNNKRSLITSIYNNFLHA